ncbi:tetratricopeptide repeat protein [Inquilinus sp. NPDC058860]|uniref:tetratricopeptide repeat protein n=1 Tax=Inquilinus sp. NPDC058860 TaxID=3346652 RepID=UPI003699B2D8
MRVFLSLAVLALVPGLSACSSLFGDDTPRRPPSPADQVPQAAALDAENSRDLYLGIVDKLRQGGKSRAALAYLDDYDNRHPGDARAQVLRADSFLDIQDYDRAEAIYRELLNGDQSAAAYDGLGRVAAGRGDWAKARAQFHEAVRREPINVKYLNDLGFAEMRIASYDEALFTLRQASELAPTNAQVRNNLILCLDVAGQADQSKAMIARIADTKERRAVEQMVRSARAQVRTPTTAGASPTTAPRRLAQASETQP